MAELSDVERLVRYLSLIFLFLYMGMNNCVETEDKQ